MTELLPETEYKIESESSLFIKLFKISGSNGEVYTFDKGTFCSPSLAKLNDSSGNTLVEFHLLCGNTLAEFHLLCGCYILELSSFQTNLTRLRFKYYYNSGYTIVGKLGTMDFNWLWKSEGYFGKKYTLVDITNENQTLAIITDTECSCKLGSVVVVNGVPSDFHKVIITFVAFMWKHKR